MIGKLTESEFADILHSNISPTSPVQSQEHLYGRHAQIREIEQALHARGRTIFIYGDRGVGKTSLAQTIAYLHQSSKHDPVLMACTPHSTFGEIILGVTNALLVDPAKKSKPSKTSAKFGYGLPQGLGSAQVEVIHAQAEDELPNTPFLDLNEAIEWLFRASRHRNENTVVVVDEFDRITSDMERAHFADFIKQIGDQGIDIRFVFCGVADSLEKLLGSHESCYRYVEGKELPRLSWDARFEIIDAAANALGVKVGEHPRFRIAAISDGFPHYVHLVCEKLFWEMFNDPHVCSEPTQEHYSRAVTQAVLGIEQHLKKAYDHATMKGTDDYEEVLWAMADHQELIRSGDSIHESYLEVMIKLEDDPMDRDKFRTRMQSLKSTVCGQVLASNRRGFYHFRENILRGYVRLRAEEQGVELALDYYSASQAPATSTWRPRGARKPRRGSSARDRERMNNPHSF